MTKNIICAGIGGQGALTLGMILAEAAAMKGENVTYVPEYGSQMRGGDSCVKLKVSDTEIINPYMERVNLLVALHIKPLHQYLQLLVRGATIIADAELVHKLDFPENTTVHFVPASKIAKDLGSPKGMNIVMAGAVVAYTDMFSYEDGRQAVTRYFQQKELSAEGNTRLFSAGYKHIKKNT